MRTVQRFLAIISVLPLAAACSSAPDAAGQAAESLGQYDAVKITQWDGSECHEVNCGLASSAMMRAVMTDSDGSSTSKWPCTNNSTCPTRMSLKSGKTMRMYYNAIALGTAFEDGHCGGGSKASLLATTLKHVHSFKTSSGYIGDNGPDLSADCLSNPKACTGKGPMSQCEFERRLSRTGGSCNGTTFLGGYVAAISGSVDNDPKGSPCYDGPTGHFIFVHDYDKSTDTFTVYDPACSRVQEASWSSARLFGWANGTGDSISGFVYGRGLQDGAGEPTDPKCSPETDASFCSRLQKNCGSVTAKDNCGTTRTALCGSCTSPDTCGGSGQENVCGYGSHDDDTDFPLASWLTGTIRNDGLCARAHLSSGEVRMTTCSSTDLNQNWKRTTSRQLQNVGSGTCAQASTGTKAGVVSHQSCSTSSLQDWAMTSVEIVQGTTGYCLSIPYGDYHDGAPVRYRSCSDKGNQKFTYDLANETISPASATNLCFDAATSSGTVNGNDITLRACNGSPSQRWNDAHRGFVNRGNASLCLGVEGGPLADAPANAEVQTCTDSTEQMWGMRGRLQLHAFPTYCLKAAPSGDQMTTAVCDANDPLEKITVWSQP